MRRSVTIGVLLCGALSLCSLHGYAEPTSSNKALATELFDNAEKLMASSDYAAACPKYRESQRLDPELGTQLHLADCYEKAGKTASAWAAFKDATEVAAKRGDPREQAARDHATALEAKLSRLTINVRDPTTPGLEVRLDGEAIGRAAWGLGAPVNPGSHKIEASATGRKPWSTTVNVSANAAKETVTVPQLKEDPQAPVAAAPAAMAPAAPPVQTPRHDQGAAQGGTQRTIGVVVAGAGVVGLAVGGVLGLGAKSKFDEASSHCDGDACDPTGIALRHEAVGRGNTATIVFGIGAAALVAGGVIWLTAPNGTTEVGLGPAGATMRGRF